MTTIRLIGTITAFGTNIENRSMEAQRVRIVEGGKLVIPAIMRRELGISAGDTVLVDIDHGELRVRSINKALENARAILRRYVPEGVSLSEELIADRRAEAERE
ncbi:AbrB/MazE/SpoVT family DNA-binding domain-containing protein [Sphingomonas panni]|uniref:AbrB/MazE/SpoVT family DNA-binding domain-containing protein n=1 Tax=Sphingomonas panni TaxID=237612 RepID=UPI001F5BD439|nr:AbrB/MazE/SpoVT family DNA-binding domain-containing protein [Sphingomonas panni]